MTSTDTTTTDTTMNGSFASFRVSSWNNHTVLRFQREAMGPGLTHIARDKVAASGWSTDMLGELGRLVEMSDGPEVGNKAWLLARDGEHLTLVAVVDGFAHVAAASSDLLRAQLVCEQVSEQIRAYDQDDRVTPITFWALDPNRWPRPIRRKVETPSWADIEANYSDATRQAMGDLLEIADCPEERMILWHGPSGTGKTHALRALAREWSSWCNVAFITDPEEFIGGAMTYSPTYLFDVANFSSGHSAMEAERRSTLIVLEDAGELMAGEARQAASQGLSRLLNLTDGLLGQGLRIMVLITTNEPLASLHPAVVRPGRCLSQIEFGDLDTDTANAWLDAHGSPVTLSRPTTLAHLYAIVTGRTPSASAL